MDPIDRLIDCATDDLFPNNDAQLMVSLLVSLNDATQQKINGNQVVING